MNLSYKCFSRACSRLGGAPSPPALTHRSKPVCTIVRSRLGPEDSQAVDSDRTIDMGAYHAAMQQAQSNIEQDTKILQQQLASSVFHGYDEAYSVQVGTSGNQEPQSVLLKSEAMDLAPEELSRRVTAALKMSHSRSVEAMKLQLNKLAKKYPGMVVGMD